MIILEINYLVEKPLFLNHAIVFSIQDASLMLYSLLAQGSAYLARIENGEVITDGFDTFEEYTDIFSYFDV